MNQLSFDLLHSQLKSLHYRADQARPQGGPPAEARQWAMLVTKIEEAVAWADHMRAMQPATDQFPAAPTTDPATT